MDWDFLQGKYPVFYAEEEDTWERFYNQAFCSFVEVKRQPSFVYSTEIFIIKADGVAVIHRSLSDDGKDEVNFFLRRLRFKNGFDRMVRQSKPRIVSCNESRQEFVGLLDGGHAFQS